MLVLSILKNIRDIFLYDYEPKPQNLLATKFRFTPAHVLYYGKLTPSAYLNKTTQPKFDGVCTTEILPILPLMLIN